MLWKDCVSIYSHVCYQDKLTERKKQRPLVSGLKESLRSLPISCLLCHLQEIRNTYGDNFMLFT